tara:strand:+ start:342 stop:473 length:132 start_codon:yes stop_codon:yes gene_type:complete
MLSFIYISVIVGVAVGLLVISLKNKSKAGCCGSNCECHENRTH